MVGEVHFSLNIGKTTFQDAQALLQGRCLALRVGDSRLIRLRERIEGLEKIRLAIGHAFNEGIMDVLHFGAKHRTVLFHLGPQFGDVLLQFGPQLAQVLLRGWLVAVFHMSLLIIVR
jgi:hypothetical protein